jgi:ATPase subunit of ABC transporter with duplicated ATPase domains
VTLAKLATARLGRQVYDLEGVTVHAGPRLILDRVTWHAAPGDRIAILGANGAGKSTLLRLLANGNHPGLTVGKTVKSAFLSQELTELPDELRLLEAVEQVARRVRLGDRELSAAQLAEVFGFTDRRVWTPVADLSGGERRRLQMLRLLATEPNVLLLDEPTNDLDTDTLAALEDLLDTWPGTMIVASHDRYLVERVCESVYALPGDGTLRHLPGGVDEYVNALRPPEPAPAAVREQRTDPRQAKKDLARLERQLEKLTQREERLHAQLAEHATDYAKVAELDEALRTLTAERVALEEQWLVLADEV